MYNVRFVKDLLFHRIKAKNRHGLHSPFVYKLVDTVFYDFADKKVYGEIEKNRNEFSKSGNNPFNTPKIDQLLYRLVANLNPVNLAILDEISPVTELYLRKAAPKAELYTDLTSSPEKLDFILISVDNEGQTLKYFDAYSPCIHENTMMVFPGIYNTSEMKETWEKIKAHPKVTVTIDLFWMGLVFFRTGQAREDFKIKF